MSSGLRAGYTHRLHEISLELAKVRLEQPEKILIQRLAGFQVALSIARYHVGMISLRRSTSKIFYQPEKEYSPMYTIVYRNLSGQVDSVTLYATSESAAKSDFYAKYDGRIITITKVV